jgi:hypothetical protein
MANLVVIKKIGGGHLKAIFNVLPVKIGETIYYQESIFGADEEELWSRIAFKFGSKKL